MQFKTMNKNEKTKAIIYLTASVLLLTAVIILSIRYGPAITKRIGGIDRESLDSFRQYLLGYGWASAVVYMLFQVVQVAIAIIPGEPVQLAGGYVFGTFLGGTFSTVGMMVGSVVAFYMARIIGMPVIRLFVSKKQLEKFDFIINSKKGETFLFLIFLIPGIPKDVMLYIAGISPVKPVKFFILYLIARLPGNFGMAYIGANIQSKNYTGAIVMAVIAGVAFLIGIIFKDKILNLLHRLIHKKTD